MTAAGLAFLLLLPVVEHTLLPWQTAGCSVYDKIGEPREPE